MMNRRGAKALTVAQYNNTQLLEDALLSPSYVCGCVVELYLTNHVFQQPQNDRIREVQSRND